MFVSHSAMILALTLLLNTSPVPYASSIGIIGGSDGPTAVYVSGCTVAERE